MNNNPSAWLIYVLQVLKFDFLGFLKRFDSGTVLFGVRLKDVTKHGKLGIFWRCLEIRKVWE